MSGVTHEVSPAASSDPLEVVEVGALNAAEAGYVRAARAANTLRGYRSDWTEWCAWSKREGYPELPATAEGISRYLSFLAGCGAKVGTMSRRLSGIRFAQQDAEPPRPHRHRPSAGVPVPAPPPLVWILRRSDGGSPHGQRGRIRPFNCWR